MEHYRGVSAAEWQDHRQMTIEE